jgi:signal transduction histidine kinase/CheY-like chemotaxis protein
MSKTKRTDENELMVVRQELQHLTEENQKLNLQLHKANKELTFQKEERGKRAAELGIANKELVFQDGEKEKRAAELGIANIELAFQDEEKGKRAAELGIANKELAYQDGEKEKRAMELGIANKELAFQDEEKEKRAAELGIANKELVFQNDEKEKRAAELIIANKELIFQNDEKEKRAAELIIANKELVFQNKEKEKRAAELIIANEELVFQNEEKEKRAAELIVANKELVFQNEEKEKRAAELNIANKELAFQNLEKEKRAAEKERRAAELIIANKELLFLNGEKEKRAAELEEKNREVEAAKSDIERKTKQLEVSSKYKSEFLANMSHELRTPLNSLLILSKDLSDNNRGNLTDDQVESAEIIYRSGHDLLILINEVLDLSKIEAGKMTINVETVNLKTFTTDLIRGFKQNAEQKGLKLNTHLDLELPDFILTDSQRLKQILKNLISNAIKFTHKGSVNVSLTRHTDSSIIISVTDTGIGIQESNQMAVFEAFQQADGTTSRKYGGTGLGLSISRELAKLLGAEITLSSKLNEGSTFSVTLPLEVQSGSDHLTEANMLFLKRATTSDPAQSMDVKYLNYPTIKDDRDSIGPEDKVVLIIEDDVKFAEVLLKLANKKGFKCLSVTTGEDGYLLAGRHNPDAIILDVGLPGMHGHELLIKLKSDPELKHIPVHIISGKEESREYLHDGAVEFLMKPVHKIEMERAFDRIEKFIHRKMKNLLIIEDDKNSRKAMKVLIGTENVNYLEAGTGEDALSILNKSEVDCIILDIDLPDMSGLDLIQKLEHLKGNILPRIIVYTGIDLSQEEKEQLNKYTKSIIMKGAESEISLLKNIDTFLHRAAKIWHGPRLSDHSPVVLAPAFFHNRKILLVDDDYRNVFALSKILKERGMIIINAENGIVALEKLETNPDIELVLMDIMMPDMDGYEAMRRIRAQPRLLTLPVIAVTAKAMNYDQQKCLDAGANAYITKPVEIEALILMMGELLSHKNN